MKSSTKNSQTIPFQGLIKSSKPSTTKQGSPYLVLQVLSTQSPISEAQTLPTVQEFTITVWGARPNSCPPLSFISISNLKTDDSFLSTSLSFVSISTPSPSQLQPFLSFLPTKVSKTQFFATIQSLSNLMSPRDSQTFTAISNRLFLPLSNGTAARTNHHNFQGGLLQHTFELLNIFLSIHSSLPFQVNPFIVSLSCLLHDIGKLKEYTSTFDYTPQFFLLGHPFLGAELAGQLLKEFNYPTSLIEHVQHCILSHHQKLEYGSPVLPASPESFLVSQLDALSGIGVQYSQPQSTKALQTQIQHYLPTKEDSPLVPIL